MKILITNHHLKNFAGSELATLELCINLKQLGHEVIVATFEYGFPLQEFFSKENIRVYDLLKESIDQKKIDLIWSHHFPVLLDVLLVQQIKAERVILYSMSSLLSNPYENFFYFNGSVLYLVNSYENQQDKEKQGIKNSIVFPNSVPSNDFFMQKKITKLNKIAIVTNHLCKELEMALPLLRETGIEVSVFGGNHQYLKITSDILINFDAIITIGKTVQYCMALSIPVYCYDHFGGPGWISRENFKTAEFYNYSGRCQKDKKTSEEIAKEIILNFNDILQDREFLFKNAYVNYNLNKNIDFVLNVSKNIPFDYEFLDHEKRNLINFVSVYKVLKQENNNIIRQREKDISEFQTQIRNLFEENVKLNEQIRNLSEENTKLNEQFDCFSKEKENLIAELNSLKNTLHLIYKSLSWKVARILSRFRKLFSL